MQFKTFYTILNIFMLELIILILEYLVFAS